MVLVLRPNTADCTGVQYLKCFLQISSREPTPVINDSDLKKVSRKEDLVIILDEKKDWF